MASPGSSQSSALRSCWCSPGCQSSPGQCSGDAAARGPWDRGISCSQSSAKGVWLPREGFQRGLGALGTRAGRAGGTSPSAAPAGPFPGDIWWQGQSLGVLQLRGAGGSWQVSAGIYFLLHSPFSLDFSSLLESLCWSRARSQQIPCAPQSLSPALALRVHRFIFNGKQSSPMELLPLPAGQAKVSPAPLLGVGWTNPSVPPSGALLEPPRPQRHPLLQGCVCAMPASFRSGCHGTRAARSTQLL